MPADYAKIRALYDMRRVLHGVRDAIAEFSKSGESDPLVLGYLNKAVKDREDEIRKDLKMPEGD